MSSAMIDIYYDTEFVDDGSTIELVSIGMLSLSPHTGELYYIVADDKVIDRVAAHPWLSQNVLPHLPVKVAYDHTRQTMTKAGRTHTPIKYWEWDLHHPDFTFVVPRSVIRDEVRRFILARQDPQLWAYFGAYDHVALAQLFGPMVDLPFGVPMYTNEFMQEWRRAGKPALPDKPKNAHNALADATWLAAAHLLLTGSADA
jgi:hypothetical protein